MLQAALRHLPEVVKPGVPARPVSEAVESLLLEDLLPRLNAFGVSDPNEYRRDEIYLEVRVPCSQSPTRAMQSVTHACQSHTRAMQ